MKIFFFIITVVISHKAMAAEVCNGVKRNLSTAQKNEYAIEVAKQLKRDNQAVQTVNVLESYQLDNWRILKVDTKVGDIAYLFYSDSPLVGNYINLWAGVARPDETAEIELWVKKNVSKLPPKLAKCFSWQVTKRK
ncbi:MAG: hypothetical protein J7501_06320 [Bdellovibrio sp.]|nr:hypothetical protein [Bdellovibrio sp.]